MADQRGGYRQPANPAPVSGPGAMSQRTDGGAQEGMSAPTQPAKYMAGLGYGKGGNMEQQQGAAIAGNPIPNFPAPTIPLSAPTQRPNEPITHGIDLGPGAGSEAMPALPTANGFAPPPSQTMQRLAQFDPSGAAEIFYRRLLDNGN